jgi:hypothetical protein
MAATPQGAATPGDRPAEGTQGDGRDPASRVSPERRTLSLGCLGGAAAIVAVMVIGGLAVVWAVDRSLERLNPFDGPLVEERTIDRSGPAVLTALTDLGEYRAASGYYELVVDVETAIDPLPSFLVGERVLFVAAGSVDSVVDFTQLGPQAIEVNDERTAATITLPPPRPAEPQLDLDRSYVVTRDRGIVDRIEDALSEGVAETDTDQLYQRAEERLAEAGARTDELDRRARDNTRAMLTSLLTSLGFTDVTVVFSDEGGGG